MTSIMSVESPWMTLRDEKQFRNQLRYHQADLRERNPELMKRLRKLSDDELDALEPALLRLMPQTPKTVYELRLGETIARLRANPIPAPQPKPSIQSAPLGASPVSATALGLARIIHEDVN